MEKLFRTAAATFAILLAVAAAAAPRKDLTLADVLKPGAFGGNQPRQVKWMPDGRAFCYFDPGPPGEAGDLMACDAVTLNRRVLLGQSTFRDAYGKLSGLKGEPLAKAAFRSYAFSPGGRFLVLEMTDGVYLWDLETASLSRILTQADHAETVTVSPDEKMVAFTSKGSLFALDRASGAKTLLAGGSAPLVTCGEADWLYGEELDLDRAFWWSPDGSKVAYLRFDETGVYRDPLVDESENHPEVRLQFYPRPGDALPKVSLHWVAATGGDSHPVPGGDSGEGYLPLVAWLPDSGGLLFSLYNRAQDQLELYRADLAGRAPSLVLDERQPAWVNVPDGPVFLKDGRFLWLSERDGFARPYLCSFDGKRPLPLTRGPWVVDSILGVDETKGFVYLSGNRENPLGCQVLRADLKGKRVDLVSSAAGWHAATLSPGAAWYLDSASGVLSPETLSLVSTQSGKARVVMANPAAELAEYGFVTPEFLRIAAADGTTLHAMLIKPRDFDPGKSYPAIVEVYGGPHAQVVQDRWSGRWMPLYQLWAQRGFAVFAADNRGSARRGKAFEDALCKRLGKTELEDQLAALGALKALPFVDGGRVGLWGWSYGGFMTLYALTHTDAFACGFAVAPVSDWLDYDACYTERYLKLPKDNPEGYRDSSPVNDAENLKGRLFFAHGLLDDNVHFANSARMADALLKAGKSFDTAYYPRMTHSIHEKPARLDLFTRMAEFFKDTLKP